MITRELDTLFWILGSGFVMSLIAMVGAFTLLIPKQRLDQLLLPLVSFAAGLLLAGALFILLPEAVEHMGNEMSVYISLALGFLLFYILEQFLHWHHCHHSSGKHRPLTYLVLVSGALHYFISGLAVAGSFMIDLRVGITAWMGTALHEIPHKLGDFGILVHGGWEKKKALLFNFFSSLTFPIAGLLVFVLSARIDVSYLVPFAAGNFLYIAAVDLVPEIKNHHKLKTNLLHFAAFVLGMLVLLLFKMTMGHSHA